MDLLELMAHQTRPSSALRTTLLDGVPLAILEGSVEFP